MIKQRERAWGGARKLTKDNKGKEGESDTPKKKQIFFNKLRELLNEMKERKRCTSRETKNNHKNQVRSEKGGKNEFDKQNSE